MRITFFATVALIGSLAATQAESAPQQIDLASFPANSVDDVVVPVPSEIFNVLDKLGSPNWKGQLRSSFGKQSQNRAQVALLLGTVIAEGFIAVEAEDAEQVKQIGREVLDLSKAIGVQAAVQKRSKSIIDFADARKWNAVRRELDGAQQDVKGAMAELNDEDLAQLVSLGGWIRGTEVLTSIVGQDYKSSRAELLHQPELISYFNRRIDSMNPRLRKSDLIARIQRMLTEIRPLILEGGGSEISPKSVDRIHSMTKEMVQTISSTSDA
ncbi:MAG: hypothetical protein WA771_10550 [Chthoniobacterales bacterium]